MLYSCELSTRKLSSYVCMAWYKHSRDWENSRQLCKPSTSSRACITVSNYPNPSRVYIRLCDHGKRFLVLNLQEYIQILYFPLHHKKLNFSQQLLLILLPLFFFMNFDYFWTSFVLVQCLIRILKSKCPSSLCHLHSAGSRSLGIDGCLLITTAKIRIVTVQPKGRVLFTLHLW